MADASHALDQLKSITLSKINTGDEFFHNCHRIILEIVNKVNINDTTPRTAKFKKNCNNIPSELGSN